MSLIVKHTPEAFFELLDKRLNKKGLTDAAIAQGAGISAPMFSMMRTGKRALSLESLIRISDFLGYKLTTTFKPKDK